MYSAAKATIQYLMTIISWSGGGCKTSNTKKTYTTVPHDIITDMYSATQVTIQYIRQEYHIGVRKESVSLYHSSYIT